MTGYKDYLIILSPPKNIGDQVKKFKQASARLIGDFEGMHGKAHITLKALRRQKPFWTEPLFAQLEKELSLIEPMILQINNFAIFLPTNFTTIYAAIKSTTEMEDWFKRIRKSLNEKKAVPHITIARQVPNALAKKLWPKFKDRHWDDEFEIDRLTILQRETFAGSKHWEPFKEIRFRGNADYNYMMQVKKTKESKVIKDVDDQQTSLF
ncbi:2'-5' RNA ligase family protein [Mucilaginibacter sp.]